MATLYEFLPQVVGLFDRTVRAVLSQPVLALLLGVLVFLLAAGMLGWVMYLGRRGKL